MKINIFQIAWINLLTLYLIFSELGSRCCHDLGWQPTRPIITLFNDKQRLAVNWLVSQSVKVAVTHQIQISRTENHMIIYNTNVSGHSLNSSEYKWTWTSDLPLNCVDHSVRVRYFYNSSFPSPWSQWATIPGAKEGDEIKVFPCDAVLREGSTATYCCVPPAGGNITNISIDATKYSLLSIGARAKAITVENLQIPKRGMHTLTCTDSTGHQKRVWNYVGFPPQKPRNLSCFTTDLSTVTCTWDPGRVPSKPNKSTLILHKENSDQGPISCERSPCNFSVIPELREYHITLKVNNSLGEEADTYSFNITDRVFPVVKWHSVSPGATNTTLSWIIQGNLNELDLVCEISNNTGPATQVHCRSVDCPCKYKVEHLLPNTGYSVSLRCSVNGRLWGKWTQTEFKTLPFVTVNLWRRIISMNDSLSRNVTLLWTPDVPGSADTVTITGYTVQWWQKDKSESLWKNSGETEAEVCIGPEQYNLNVKASVHNGFSIPAHVIIPKLDDREKIPKKMQLSSSTAGGFNLSWTDYGNATCGYTVEWYIMGDTPPSLLQWKKIPEGYNALQLPADNFRAGCRYTFNIYGCTENGYKLLEIQTGYSQETVMVPRPRLVEPIQKTSSSVTLHWHYNEDDDSNPAFIIGYLVKVEDMGPNTQPGFRKAVLNVTVADPLRKFVTIEGLKQNHDYNFTVSALTKKGSGPAVSITIRTRINYSTLWVGSLIFILSLLGCTVLLCSQRKLLKRKVTELFVYPAGMNIRTVELQRFLEQTGEMVQPHRTEDCVSCEIHIVKFLPHVNKTPSTLQFPVAATTPFPASLSLTSPLLSSLTPSCMPVQDYSPQLVTLIEKDPALQQVNDITNMIYFHSMMDDFPEAEGDAMSGKVKLNFGPSDCQQESCIVTYGYISNEML